MEDAEEEEGAGAATANGVEELAVAGGGDGKIPRAPLSMLISCGMVEPWRALSGYLGEKQCESLEDNTGQRLVGPFMTNCW